MLDQKKATKKQKEHKKIRAKVKPCYFCKVKEEPSYKDEATLRLYIDEDGRIKSSRRTGICAKHQHALKLAIENARKIAILPIPGKTSIF